MSGEPCPKCGSPYVNHMYVKKDCRACGYARYPADIPAAASPPKQAAEGGREFLEYWQIKDEHGDVLRVHSVRVAPPKDRDVVVELIAFSAFQRVVEERDRARLEIKYRQVVVEHAEGLQREAEKERDEARAEVATAKGETNDARAALSHAVTMAKEAQAREDEARAEVERLRTAISTFFTSHKGLEGMSEAYKGLRASLEGGKT
jgi:hypothetical protein